MHSILFDNSIQRIERNENTEHLPVTVPPKWMLTSYNFGAARDPEVLHKILNSPTVVMCLSNTI